MIIRSIYEYSLAVEVIGSVKKYQYTQDYIMFIIFYLSLPTAYKTISDEITFAVIVGKVQG